MSKARVLEIGYSPLQMLEITLLKTRHEGEEEARKLRSHIADCDVFCPEFPFSSSDQSTATEHQWDQIQDEVSMLAPLSEWLPLVGVMPDGGYFHALFKELYLNKKPIHLLERWSPGQVQSLDDTFTQANNLFIQGAEAALHGDTAVAAEHYYKGFVRRIQLTERRDRHIAKNIEVVEAALRARDERFSRYATIHCAIQIGAAHALESYCALPVTVVDLAPIETDPLELHFSEAEQLIASRARKPAVLSVLREATHVLYARGALSEATAALSTSETSRFH